MSESVLDKEGFYDFMCFNCGANIDLSVSADGSIDMDGNENLPLTDDGKTLICYLCGVDSVVCSHSAVKIVSDMVLSMPIGCSNDADLGVRLTREIKKKMKEKFLNKSAPEPFELFGSKGNVIKVDK